MHAGKVPFMKETLPGKANFLGAFSTARCSMYQVLWLFLSDVAVNFPMRRHKKIVVFEDGLLQRIILFTKVQYYPRLTVRWGKHESGGHLCSL